MSYNDNQNENPLPVPGDNNRSTSDLLPKFFRTEANRKFLQGTLDQLVNPGVAEKISGFIGRKTAKAYTVSDNYIGDVSAERENYQLEPAALIKDNLDNVTFYKDYNDYLGSLNVFGANTDNHDRLNAQEYYAWDPHIDWDKFINFREYYWLPNGPLSIPVRGQQRQVTSTYTVSTVTDDDNTAYIFNDGFERNPTLKLYRGQTYRFEIDTPGHPIAFAITRSFTPGSSILTAGSQGLRADGLFDSALYGNEYDQGEFIILPSSGSVTFEDDDNVSTLYPDGIRKLGENGEEVATVYVEKGTIEFTIPTNAPDRLFYVSKNNIDTSGLFRIYDVEENTFLNVENDILGKKTYRTEDGLELSNGMKLRFVGDVEPAQYSENQWYVEGVGDKIRLIKDSDLIIPAAYSENRLVPFDSDQFDTRPFANASSFAAQKDYLVINRSSQDRNAWSRYNRWFHRTVIEESFIQNNLSIDIDEEARAKRPIIEFEAGLKLFQFGTFAKQDVDLVDTFTTDVFSTIEGQIGYNVDGIDFADGMRVLFTADTDVLVNGKIYEVKFVTIGQGQNAKRQISLVETEDSTPLELETVFVTAGNTNAGKTFFYDDNNWKLAQEKIQRNQPPRFDLCCPDGNAYSDTSIFDSSSFTGTKIFSYREGTGANDTELNFPLTYRNIENSGDILFDFNLLSDVFSVQMDDNVELISTSTANLRKYKNRDTFDWVNGWSTTPNISKQYVIRQYSATTIDNNNFEIDVYDNAGDISDLKTIVHVNNRLLVQFQDYEIDRLNKRAFVRLYNNLNDGDTVILKTKSSSIKNQNGYYEFPSNLERNPLNEDISEFTLGEVIDHVDSIVEELTDFSGVFPGKSNIRDLGRFSFLGKKFVKHSGPINLPLYHITSKDYNIVKALRYSRDEYAKFKRVFIETATSLGIDTDPKTHVDKILEEINKDKLKSQPFYFSDMLAYGPFNRIDYTVVDSRNKKYSITEIFNLDKLSEKSVYVYLNETQLIYQKDYTFDNDGFVVIETDLQAGDSISIIEYTTSDGSFVPPTPTKLGLYPKYEPELTIDDTYQTANAENNGPYKIYGQVSDGFFRQNTTGWFYPVFTTQQSAQEYATTQGFENTDVHSHQFVGLNTTFYMPNTGSTHGGQDNVELDAYPIGVPMIRGHDGSFIRAYLDYRDNLILELEKRIFNNIKIDWSENITDVFGFIGGDFRQNDFTREEVNRSLLVEFTQWLKLVDNDFSDNYFYDRLNEFTFNYSNANNPDNQLIPGFWRGIYKRAFDTDRPHTQPWEMLGFTIKPKWWNETYGPAPYTSDNLILWRDLEQGIVREPGKEIIIKPKYSRPGLTNFIPVDSQGHLKSPLASGYVKNFVLRLSTGNFDFGDEAPVETAWRRSSHYPFSVIVSMLLNNPAKVFGTSFDVSRIKENLAGQKVYTETGKQISTQNITFPNTYVSETRTLTSGLINYIYNLIASDVLSVYSDYQTNVTNLTNQLGFKLAGFTDKQKLNLILESRTPSSETSGGVFVPQENYQIFFNTSSPTELVVYSGVVIEKVSNGFVLRGYNNDAPFFEYHPVKTGSSNVPVTVGGISEVSSQWEENKRFIEGQIIENNNVFYRATNTFTADNVFSTENLIKIPELPIVGGKTALFYKNFDTTRVERISYGTLLSSSQDVVNFLLGYGARLETLGFEFDNVDDGETVDNWRQSAREFLFWTTQGWAEETIITISPAANSFKFQRDFNVVDDIYDDFYTYSILQADGQALPKEFNSLLRDQNSFGIRTVKTDEGLYSIALPLVQKEHVVILNNKTVFNDLIYQPSTGYRRDRIKVSGFRSDNWNGGLNIPGFVFDDAKTEEWTQWKDYRIGNLIKYKQFYYVATENVVGSSVFDANQWYRLNDKPEPELLTNFDYRVDQFNDYYELDTSGFDAELQQMAQHLTGYQKRQYLTNIINDDISQYKFYQGMIQEKGSKNSLTKLFNKLSTAGEESLEFYEDWAIQVGRYGSVDKIEQIEINLEEDKLQESPQAIELVNSLPPTNFDKIYRILPFEMYDRPADYNHAPFPTAPIKNEYIRSAGYVNEEDVTFIAGVTEELSLGDVNLLELGKYVWVTESNAFAWNVYQHIATNANVTQLEDNNETNANGIAIVELTLDKWAKDHVTSGDFVGIIQAQEYGVNGIYKVDSINLEKVKIQVPNENDITVFAEEEFKLTKLRTVRLDDLDAVSVIAQEKIYPDQRVWVDQYDDDWKVLENNAVYLDTQVLTNISDFDSTMQEFASVLDATPDNNYLFVGAPGDVDGKIFVYRRSKETSNLTPAQELVLQDNDIFEPANSGFGKSISVSPDGEFLAVGLPDASGIKTRFKGEFDPDLLYNKNEIVKYRESLWKANRQIFPKIESQTFNTFDTYISIANDADLDSTSLKLLATGDPGLENNIVDHVLVRAPQDMYLGTRARDNETAGDTINLYWNRRSYAYPTLDIFVPFDGEVPEISIDWLQQEHEIEAKIDDILYLDTFITLPQVGDTVSTDTGQAEVYYVSTFSDSAVLYLINTNGVFDIRDELYVNDDEFAGFYTQEDTYNTSDAVRGFWLIKTFNVGQRPEPQSQVISNEFGFTYSNNRRYFDVGRGLVYSDVKLANDPERPTNEYYNIQDTIVEIGSFVTLQNRVSFVTQLSFTGDMASEDGVDGEEKTISTNKWVVRVGKSFSETLSETLSEQEPYELRLFELEGVDLSDQLEAAGIKGNYSVTNGTQTIEEIWDGYIDFELSRFDFSGFPFQPQIGDIIEDVQFPRDGAGGLALTSETTSSAEVVWVQRNFNNIRVYVTNVEGSWQELTNIGRFDIRRKANTVLRGPGDADRIIGTVEDSDNNIVVGNNLVGKLLVFYADKEFAEEKAWDEIPPVVNEEYFFFRETTVSGIGRLENPPYALNKDYTQVYNISADQFGTPGPDNEGAFAIYRRLEDNTYTFENLYVSEYAAENKRFGKDVKFAQIGNYYTLFVSSEGFGTANDIGNIEIYRHGTKPTDNFKGEYKLTSYSEGDIVIYKDDYYVALKDIPASENRIQDPVFWNNISWRRSKDSNYRGEWNNLYPYSEDSIVRNLDKFYKTSTNTAAGDDFNETIWEEVSEFIDYVGYIPNLTGLVAYNENIFDPAQDDLNIQFSKNFDVSTDGQVLITTVKFTNADSSTDTRILVYRETDNKFLLDQIILAPDLINVTDWANSVSINPDGTKFAVSASLDDTAKVNQGQVFVYQQVNSVFELVQTLTPPNNEENEQFGYAVNFGNDNLVVSSLNGDQKIPTTFDEDLTKFDNEFTNFRNVKLDSGVVYIFENLNGVLVYSEQLRYDSVRAEFGEILLSKNNHIYVGIPRQRNSESSKGTCLDYRKPKETYAWKTLRQSVTPVDISRIEGIFLYNKRSNEIVSYIDYVDPIQGKIPGIVEQELTYKTGFDPAVYNVGDTEDLTVDPTRYWGAEHAGQTWWNIDNARFAFPYQGTTTFQKNEWNKLTPGSSIDIYEWVESDYLPSQWNQLADTDDGVALGISGTAINGDNKYSAKLTYDDVSQTFSTKYFFWVTNKRTIPANSDRNLSIFDMTALVERPREQGYRFVSFLTDNKLVLNNFDNIITSNDLVLNIRYNTGSKKIQNTHSQYLILSDGLETSKPDPDIERKWFDSLIGYDSNNRVVPDPNIPVAKRYGIQNRPRQGMFVNRIEALKQFIERINLVLENNLIIDQYNIESLFGFEETPTLESRLYDINIENFSDLSFVSTNKVSPVVLNPVVLNGKLNRVEIVDSGRGYKVPPRVEVLGKGNNADVELSINNLGQVIAAEVINDGSGYDENTALSARRYTVLIDNDETLDGKWALYSYDDIQKEWIRSAIQSYDVSRYWTYIDWYADGYNQFTKVNFEIEGTYLLNSISDAIGNVVKVKNVGAGGWLLLEKIANENTEDYIINYKVIGRQNGTIQFKDNLYDFSKNSIGFDNRSFDSVFYDNNPSKELRIILETLRDKILVVDLEVEYNQLFFASLRYILAEQQRVDWLHKTSFLKIKHNLGNLEQKINFENNKLPSYQSYVEEVKPYSSKIREFISAYSALDNTNSSVTDFDNPPTYDVLSNQIITSDATIQNGTLFGQSNLSNMYPRKHWADNIGFVVKEIRIDNPGDGYTNEPNVTIVSDEGSGATAKAYVGYGQITKIEVITQGAGYISTPRVLIDNPADNDAVPATASAILGNGLARTPTIKIKFDRTSGTYTVQDLAQSETFTGTNVDNDFNLKWPMDLDSKKVKVYVDGVEQLRSKYSYTNIQFLPEKRTLPKDFEYGNSESSASPGTQKISNGYTYEKGRITFTNPPASGSEILIEYFKPLNMLSAEDRIKFAYTPIAGMLGNDLAQLMTGVDYGGVEVKSFEFGGPSGWDSQGWYTDTWDTFDNTFEDEIFVSDGSTIAVELSTPLENGTVYNLYKNGVRIDDPNYDAGTPTNPDAIVNSITGDGITTVIDLQSLGVIILDNDILIVRKVTSDGSIVPDPSSYDQQLSGGDLAYQSARGVNPEEAIIDGDGFVTPITSGGPEELVPGQVLDTLDIQVYTRESGGQGVIYNQNYIMDSNVTVYDLGIIPGNEDSVLVKLDNIILNKNEYNIDWNNNTVEILNPQDGVELNIITQSLGTKNILDYGIINSVENQYDYIIDTIEYNDNLSVYLTTDGTPQDVTLTNNSTVDSNNRLIIRFETPRPAGEKIYFVIFSNDTEVNYSQVYKESFTGDGANNSFELQNAPFYSMPSEQNVLVKVGNSILNAGYNKEFVISELSEREFALELFQISVGSLATEDVKVYLNGVEIFAPTQWRLEIANSSIVLADETGFPGDLVEIYVIKDAEYVIEENLLTLVDIPDQGTEIEIYQFSNHDIKGIERISYDVVSRTNLFVEDIEFITFNRLKLGEITLRKPAVDAEYVWVTLNGELLTPSVDYYLTDDKNKIRLVTAPSSLDTIEIIHFTNTVNIPRFAYRQFKDMLNRSHFKRLDTPVTVLAEPLNQYDLRIELLDGSQLPEPNKGNNIPGIIYIDGERIEYLVKEDNTLRQLRRGTLGTGVPLNHAAGSLVFDQSISKTIPYKDETQTLTFEADGYSEGSTVRQNIGNISVSKIEFDFNNNTVFPLGGQVATVFGEGFRPVIELYPFNEEPIITIDATAIDTNNRIKLVPPAFYVAKSWNTTLLGKTVTFSESVFGGVSADTDYVVSEIITSESSADLSGNEVYIKITQNETEVELTDGVGEMKISWNSTTYIDENRVQFITSGKSVGSYDLIIYNPPEPLNNPFPIDETSFVAEGLLEYVQILLPFAPLPDERSATNWYKTLTEISVTDIVPGRYYTIASLGDTEWSIVGAFGNSNEDFLATAGGTGTGTVYDYSSIPYDYWESKDIDVFANGIRLKKSPAIEFDPSLGLDSPEGDVFKEAEFAVNRNIGAYVRLTNPPEQGTLLTVVRKQGRVWTKTEETLAEAQNSIAKFIRAGSIELPK